MADDDLTSVLIRYHRQVLVPEVERMLDARIGPLHDEMVTLRDEMLTHFDDVYKRFDRIESQLSS